MTSKRIGMNLKRLREANGLTQAALAKKAKLHRVSLARMEAQTIIPTVRTLERLAKALKVDVAELLR